MKLSEKIKRAQEVFPGKEDLVYLSDAELGVWIHDAQNMESLVELYAELESRYRNLSDEFCAYQKANPPERVATKEETHVTINEIVNEIFRGRT